MVRPETNRSATPSTSSFLRLHLLKQRVQRFKASLPVPPELLRPQHRLLERSGPEAAEMLTPSDAPTHEIGPLQHAHVLGCGRKRHLERRGELAQVAFAAVPGEGKPPDDRTPGGVSQRVKNSVEPGGMKRNHVVYYTKQLSVVKGMRATA